MSREPSEIQAEPGKKSAIVPVQSVPYIYSTYKLQNEIIIAEDIHLTILQWVNDFNYGE